jgi:hypothetical protein
MGTQQDVVVERVRDEGQWFDRGLRVELTRPTVARSAGRIEKAVFGAYEVLGCAQEEADGEAYLTVRLRRFAHR